jgi:predicted acyltransferase
VKKLILFLFRVFASGYFYEIGPCVSKQQPSWYRGRHYFPNRKTNNFLSLLMQQSQSSEQTILPSVRFQSLDVIRGLIMVFLAAESCRVYTALAAIVPGGIDHPVVRHFFHHPWHGLHFWDLVQPAFMTIAGTSLAISWHHKKSQGLVWSENLQHVLWRCFKLALLGMGLHCIYAGEMVFELWNVLTQLSFTTLVAYIIIDKPASWQWTITIVLLFFSEWLYRNTGIAGFDQPFVSGYNFGNWLDLQLMGKTNSDGWVTLNALPTSAHTIWGVIAGQWLMKDQQFAVSIRKLIIAGLLLVLSGYFLDIWAISPIIKRICTSSFVLVSGGWVFLLFALFLFVFDCKKYISRPVLMIALGTNAIFIYLFFETVGVQWLNNTVQIFANGFSSMIWLTANWAGLLGAFVTWALECYLCLWLYRRNVLIKL